MLRSSIPLRNALAYAAPELLWGMAWALTIDGPMVAAYRSAFGGGEHFVGIVWMVGSLAIGIAGLFSAQWVEPMKHKRAFVFWGHVAGGVILLVTALAIRLGAAHSPVAASVIYIVGTGCFFITIGVLIPGWLGLVGELFDGGTQARVLGITFVFNKLAAIFAGQVIVRQVLSNGASPVDQWSTLFGIAGAVAVVGSFPYRWIVEQPRPRPPRKPIGDYLRSLLQVLRELPVLRRFIAADVIGITAMITLAFYADAAIQSGRFADAWAGHWVAVGALAQVVMSGLIAWLGSRVHPRTWFLLGTVAAILSAVGAAYGSTNLPVSPGTLEFTYGLAAAGVGIYMGVRAACHGPFVMRLAPGRDGTAPIGISVALTMLVQGFGPVIAGFVIRLWGYLPVFSVVAVCGVISLVFLLLRVPRDVSTGAAGHAVSNGG